MIHKANNILRKIIDWKKKTTPNTLDTQPELPNKPNDNTQSAANSKFDNKNNGNVIMNNSDLKEKIINDKVSGPEKRDESLFSKDFEAKY